MDYKKTTATAILRSFGVAKYHYERLVEEANAIQVKTQEDNDRWMMIFFQAGCFLRHAVDFSASLENKGGPFMGFLQEDNEDAEAIRNAMKYFEHNYNDWTKTVERMEKDAEEHKKESAEQPAQV